MANVKDTVAGAKPVVGKLAKDEKLRRTLLDAFATAREVYTELDDEKKAQALATRVAGDPKLQKQLRKTIVEVQKAGKRATKKSHKKRNALILAGITVGLLYNPATGPDTRRWIKEKISGSDDTFDYELEGGNGSGVPPAAPADEPAAS